MMTLSDYRLSFASFFAGMLLDVRNKITESFPSSDSGEIGFGLGVVPALGSAVLGTVRLPRVNSSTLTASTDLGSGNSTVVTVNGNATTATVYASSHANTMGLIAVKVAALTGVKACTVAGDVLTITSDDVDLTVSAVTSSGSAVTWTAAYSTRDTFKGVAQWRGKEGTLPTPSTPSVGVGYILGETVSSLHRGLIAGQLADAVLPADQADAYIIVAAAGRGKFTDVSTGNLKVGTFRRDLDTESFAVAGGQIPVEVKLP